MSDRQSHTLGTGLLSSEEIRKILEEIDPHEEALKAELLNPMIANHQFYEKKTDNDNLEKDNHVV